MATNNSSIRILFLAAIPPDIPPLKLAEECRAIDQALRMSDFRDYFDLQDHWAVQIDDLQELLMRHKPHIVHFSGHGSPSNEIILHDTDGRSRPLSPETLSRLFSLLSDNIKCVVLNACYSARQAQEIAKHISCVVGISDAISDDAAIKFSTAFYRALGFGRDMKTAFELGRLEIESSLSGLEEHLRPQLLSSASDPSSNFMLQPQGLPFSMRLSEQSVDISSTFPRKDVALHRAKPPEHDSEQEYWVLANAISQTQYKIVAADGLYRDSCMLCATS